MNWMMMAFGALLAGGALLWRARRAPAIQDAAQLGEASVWGYFLVLVGMWGMLSQFANPSDLFFLMMMAAALMAGLARLLGYRRSGNQRPLPGWAAFGFANALVLASIGTAKAFVIEPMQIPSSSMRPGLLVGDFILVNKAAYGVRLPFLHKTLIPTGKPARGDVAVFRLPYDPSTNLIKRVVGLPGDRVVYRDKQLSINGVVQASTDQGHYDYRRESGADASMQLREERLDGKPHLILNDPAMPSLNPMLVRDFAGRDACRHEMDGFECTVPAGQYLVLGDNRDDSNDGRYWGFLPEENLAGRAAMVWMNWAGLGHWPDWRRIGKQIA
ncbi:signal peptidase I [Chitinimonas sp.]|uniref:signal peptidase I n=1 Tax=Chitinimonas sp. TaxID=1934313 RepID=UPI0035AFD6F1